MEFNVCSFNMGASSDDYKENLLHRGKNFLHGLNIHYEVAKRLTKEMLDGKAEVYCLQEVVSEDNSLVKDLKIGNFEIIHLKGTEFDTAIAIDKTKFTKIENHSIQVKMGKQEKDVAIAKAVDKMTGKSVVFVSAHIPGFSFETKDYAQEHYGIGTEYEVGKSANMGNLCCQEISKKLSKIGKGAIQVIGADMNALHIEKTYYENEPKGIVAQKHERFKILQNHGFKLLNTGSTTNVSTRSEIHKEREIDFFFSKKSTTIWQGIKSFFWSDREINTSINKNHSITWEHSCSDHLPIFLKVIEANKPSKLRQLWGKVASGIDSVWQNLKKKIKPEDAD